MDNEIVQLTDYEIENSWGRVIRGLNIFYVNGVDIRPEDDPRIHLMIELMRKRSCSVLIGHAGVSDMGGNLAELTGSYSQTNPPERVHVGCYIGGFYSRSSGHYRHEPYCDTREHRRFTGRVAGAGNRRTVPRLTAGVL